jgi:hypothetical protein
MGGSIDRPIAGPRVPGSHSGRIGAAKPLHPSDVLRPFKSICGLLIGGDWSWGTIRARPSFLVEAWPCSPRNSRCLQVCDEAHTPVLLKIGTVKVSWAQAWLTHL